MLSRFFYRSFALSFLPIFLTLIFIVSIIVLFQIAKLTAYVELELVELLKLFLLMGVKLLVFALPISFFLAISTACKRASEQNETIALFALGLSPWRFAAGFLPLAGAFSAALLIMSLIFIPMSFSLYDNFVDYKKTIAKISLKTANYGQKWGDWLYFSQSASAQNFGQITLLNTRTFELITASAGSLRSEDGWVKMQLKNAQYVSLLAFTPRKITADSAAQNPAADQNLPQPPGGETPVTGKKSSASAKTAASDKTADSAAQFASVYAGDILLQVRQKGLAHNLQSWLTYWQDLRARASELVIYVMLSLLPLLGLLWGVAWGVFFERLERSTAAAASFVFLMLYFVPISALYRWHLFTIAGSAVFFSLLGAAAFMNRLKNY